MNIQGMRFLVVGGSGALGSELVRQLHKKGAQVLATASSNESAAAIPSVAEVRLLLDFESSESVKTLADYLTGSTAIDGVVNASGVVAFGPASELSKQTLDKLFAINAIGPISLFNQLLPLLRKSKEAGKEPVILSISGVVAENPMPSLAAYSASKTAISGFLEAVSREWRREGIRVVNVFPGHTETGLAQRAIAGKAPQFPQGMTAEHVVQRIISALENDEKSVASSEF